ncbi:MAG: ABC transporter substrate-binding protein [Candidatus Competibacteraceae bacterium]
MRRNQSVFGVGGVISSRLMACSVSLLIGVVLMVWCVPDGWAAESGVTSSSIRVGGVMPLEGDFRNYGLWMKAGIEAALKGEKVQGRTVEFVVRNDFYDPAKTEKEVRELIQDGIFLMMGSFGTSTTQKALPILAENKVPAMGFYTGAGFTGPGEVLNVRASYAHEVATVIEAVITAGVKPSEVCAYAQNDAYGMAGLQGFKMALTKHPDTGRTVGLLDQILTMPGDNPPRNNIGPVGVYQRGIVTARDGYQSLKKWEAATGTRCRLVVTIGTYDETAQFIGYARGKGEKWLFSAPSPAAGDTLKQKLKLLGVTDGVIVTQVVPPLDSPLPVVQEARAALKSLDYVSLEGYIVGKLFLAIARATTGELTRASFLKAAHNQVFDLGGFKVDFTKDNQGSTFVLLAYLNAEKYEALPPRDVGKVLPP